MFIVRITSKPNMICWFGSKFVNWPLMESMWFSSHEDQLFHFVLALILIDTFRLSLITLKGIRLTEFSYSIKEFSVVSKLQFATNVEMNCAGGTAKNWSLVRALMWLNWWLNVELIRSNCSGRIRTTPESMEEDLDVLSLGLFPGHYIEFSQDDR